MATPPGVQPAAGAPPSGGPRAGTGAATSRPRRRSRRIAIAGLATLAVAAAAFFLQREYRADRLSSSVRELIAARRFGEARPLIDRWLALRPRSAEGHFGRALVELGEGDLPRAAASLEEAHRLGLDRSRASSLRAVLQARSGRATEAEPALIRAFLDEAEPKADVAQELARRYLSTYRLGQARPVIERWRSQAPEDARPYLWLNEIESRTDGEPATQIENYRAALDRDPSLVSARLGLAAQLLKVSRLDEAEHEYRECLARKPADAEALVGLGRTLLRRGDVEAAARQFEAALEADPREPDGLRELAQIELSQGKDALACSRLEVLVQVEPHDHGVRYQYAQALRRAGEEARSREQFEKANALRRENERLVQLRSILLARPGDMEAQFEVASWLLEHGHDAEGLDWTRKILQSDPRHARTHRLLADYYAGKGNEGLANYHRLMAGGEAGAKKGPS
ncbi:MAG: tetratricopeptide repeat protein [Isosphaeraceae bacterium]